MPKQLVNLRIDEVSSVDRGAGKGVRVMLMKRLQELEQRTKREFSSDERREAAHSGAALPDGSFPIKDKQDLKNAIQAIGRAKDPAKAKAHIKARARALGATDMLPDSWSKRESDAHKALALAIDSILKAGGGADKLTECFSQFHEYLSKGDGLEELNMTNEELIALVNDTVAKGIASAVAELEKNKGKKPGNNQDNMDQNDGDADDADKNMTDKQARDVLTKLFGKDRAAEIAKMSAPEVPDKVDTELAKRDAEIVDLRKHVQRLTEQAQVAEFAKRAEEIGMTKAEGEHLRKAYTGDVASLKFLEDTIKKLHTQVEKAGLFGEVGSTGASPATPHDELMAKAAEIRKASAAAGKPITEAQAYVRAMDANPELVKREREESHARIQKIAQ